MCRINIINWGCDRMITPPMLHKLEKNYGIKVLFAVESGSRLWRMESTEEVD